MNQGKQPEHARIAELEAELVKEAARTADYKLRAEQFEQRLDMANKLGNEARAELAALKAAPAAQAVEPSDADLIALNASERYFSESPSKYPEAGHGTQYHAGAPGVIAFARAAIALRATPPAPASDAWRTMIEGMSVSVDVSTGEHDAGNRYFGAVTEVMDDPESKHGVTLLIQDAKPNFALAAPQAQDVQDAGEVISDLASALDMLVGSDPVYSLCEHEGMDVIGRVKGT